MKTNSKISLMKILIGRDIEDHSETKKKNTRANGKCARICWESVGIGRLTQS